MWTINSISWKFVLLWTFHENLFLYICYRLDRWFWLYYWINTMFKLFVCITKRSAWFHGGRFFITHTQQPIDRKYVSHFIPCKIQFRCCFGKMIVECVLDQHWWFWLRFRINCTWFSEFWLKDWFWSFYRWDTYCRSLKTRVVLQCMIHLLDQTIFRAKSSMCSWGIEFKFFVVTSYNIWIWDQNRNYSRLNSDSHSNSVSDFIKIEHSYHILRNRTRILHRIWIRINHWKVTFYTFLSESITER